MQHFRLALFVPPLLLAGCSIHIDGWSSQSASREEHFEFPVDAATAIQVVTHNGFIEASAADGSSIVCDVKFTASAATDEEARRRVAELRLEQRRDGDRLVLEVVAPDRKGNYGASLRLQVPLSLALQLDTSNGDIDVLATFPEVRADTSNGSVQAKVDGGAAVLDSSNGSLTLAGAPSRFELTTSNGSVTVHLPDGWSGSGAVDTSNGSIRVECAGRLGCTVSADTSNSRVQVSGGEVRLLGSAEEAQGPHIDLDTSNGPIVIRQQAER